jgi:hypothetical protein
VKTPVRSASFQLQTLFREEFESRPVPAAGLISAVPIPSSPTNRLGRDERGNACIIIAVAPGGTAGRPDVRLQNLSVRRRAKCEIVRTDGERETLQGLVVTCSAASSDLRSFFLDLFDQALDNLGTAPSELDVDAWIDHAYRLFAELDDPTAREIRGLWGELLIIASSRDPEVLVRRWHDDPRDRFDFFVPSFALEVKTCRDLDRVHVFSLAQLRPSTDTEVVVASVPVRSDPAGVSAVELLTEVEGRLQQAESRARLREVTFRIGGAALAESPQRFDRRSATAAIRYLRASAIPAFESAQAQEILSVQLTIQCANIPSNDLAAHVLNRLHG